VTRYGFIMKQLSSEEFQAWKRKERARVVDLFTAGETDPTIHAIAKLISSGMEYSDIFQSEEWVRLGNGSRFLERRARAEHRVKTEGVEEMDVEYLDCWMEGVE